MAAALTVAVGGLTGCTAPSSYVVLRADGVYRVADSRCPGAVVASLRVVNWNEQERTEFGGPRIAKAAAAGTRLPEDGLPIAGDLAGTDFTAQSSGPLDLSREAWVVIDVEDGLSDPSGTYSLRLQDGEYVDSSGEIRPMTDLAHAQQDCA